ncbi:MAG: ATP-grasp domain-containing protein [Lentisphaeraceae bacterium]|nr:ATP-grasp domain-containing protein [Lentisphaeraceae bacterium]
MNVLFLNAGRRCELVKSFKRVLSKFPGGGLVFGSDISPLASALQFVDEKVLFPHSSDPSFYSEFMTFCKLKKVDLVIPTIDPDLVYLDQLRNEISKALPKLKLLLPSSEIISMSADKKLTKKAMLEMGVTVPAELEQGGDVEFPIFVKPIKGSSAIGAARVNNRFELEASLLSVEEPILEKFIDGPEFTVDVYCSKIGGALMAIPRKRLSVRGGEVSKGVVERKADLEEIAMSIANSLKCNSPITIQFKEQDGQYYLIEINARLGGGLPLTIAAGANWPLWILNETQGRDPGVEDGVLDGMIMSRFDDSVFIKTKNSNKEEPDLTGVKSVIFDMDDTLYPEREFVYSGYREVAKYCLENYGVYVEDELRRRFEYGERGDLFSTVFKSLGLQLKESEILKLVRIYRTHKPSISPFVDVEILKELYKDGYTLGLISDGWHEVQEAKWNALGLDKYFTHKIFTDSLGKDYWKPHPRSYELMNSWLGLDYDKTVYVADNVAKDFIAPNKLGMHSLKINRYGSVHAKELAHQAENEAEYEIDSLVDLRRMLKGESKK